MSTARAISFSVVLALGQLALAAEPSLPEPIKTNQRSFTIPFDLQEVNPHGGEARELRLHVSLDGGKTWAVAAKAAPGDGQFEFSAPDQGEYWFRTTTLDENGKDWPLGDQPELRVIVSPLRAEQQVVAGFPVNRLPKQERPRMVNSLAFELDYDLQSAGSTGQVELWWTGDGGVSWRRFGADDDQQSPLLVSVDREGLYGFWLVIENEKGVRSEPPAAGQLPQIWVGVDTTRPKLRLLGAEMQAVPDGQELTVHWDARDALLSSRPMSLAYAASAGGPWLELESQLENRGVYRCVLPRRIPSSIYLHLQVRDEAGNIEAVDSTQPVVLTARRAGPQAR